MQQKKLEIVKQIKILCPKKIFNSDFALAGKIIHDHKISVLVTFST